MKLIALIALSVVCLGAFNSLAKDPPNPFKATLQSVPSAELPAKAAQLVKDAATADRESVTINVVKAAVGINPAAARAIVGAIARAVPAMAPLAAATAAGEQPKQASDITKAAAAAAPSMVSQIVAAVCRVVPNAYRSIAAAASEAVPGADKEILSGVAAALPDLKPYVMDSLVNYRGSSVAATLAQSPPPSRGPAIGPPYIPPSGTPTNTSPSGGGPVPPGGRGYAAP